MREIIHIGLGNCGVRIGCKFYEQLIQEYQIEANRTCEKPQEGIEVHFSEIGDKKFVPRSILYSRDVEQILANPQSLIFNPNNYQLDLLESLRKELEICDNCQGLQVSLHLSTDINLKEVFEEYSCPIQVFTVFPDNDAVRSALNLSQLQGTNIVAFDNYGLNEQFAKVYKSSITYSDYNGLIATVMNAVTSPMRCNGNTTLQRIYSVSSPMNVEVCKVLQDKQTLINLQQVMESRLLIETDPKTLDRIIQVTLFARTSQMSANQLHQQLQYSSSRFYNNFINVNYHVVPFKQELLVSLMKSSHIKYKLEQLKGQVLKMQQKKAFNSLYDWENQEELVYLDNLIKICNEIINTHQETSPPPPLPPMIPAASPNLGDLRRNETKRMEPRLQEDQIRGGEYEASPKKQISFQQSILKSG
ncbi:hypothetical protein FGO68_gene11648 [Halteria grandinella]|uniref:Tubulin/FtsZ GTPase domain-containing protein n=1 Tax=Halteria grandinella TaxID=5974 RepID=A0A8J8NAU4_HALGN|nr:hypothetical protein FGO68_gene11648 [Halteria grandinella]